MLNRNHSIKNRNLRRVFKSFLYAILIFIFIIDSLLVCKSNSLYAIESNPEEKGYQGDSGRLKATVIVPSLESLMPKRKNVIWCSSFQIAWNSLKNKIFKRPIQIKNAETVVNLLNRATQSE